MKFCSMHLCTCFSPNQPKIFKANISFIGVKRVIFFIFAPFRSIKTMYLVVTGVVFQKIVLKKAIELEIRPFSLKRPIL